MEARWQRPLSVRYLRDSVRTMLRARDLRSRLGEFDFIYSWAYSTT
jgi:hypothetical protein